MKHITPHIPALFAALLICALAVAQPVPTMGQTPAQPTPTPIADPTQPTDSTGASPALNTADAHDASGGALDTLREQITTAVRDALAATPGSITLLSLDFDGRVLTIDLSPEARPLADQGRFAELMGPIDTAVSTLLAQLGQEQQRNIDYLFLIDGAPLAPAEEPAADPAAGGGAGLDAVNGQRIVINPGHGWYNDSGTWRLQRGYWWGVVEDFINAELAIQLRAKLAAVGADVRSTRELNKAAGTNTASGKPLWEAGAAAYTKQIGAPASVYAASTSAINNDIMARPYYANWVGASATISLHNNGGRGCGTETWYDTSNGYASQSYALAQRIQAKIIERVRAQWSAGWCNRGVKGSNGGYGENRYVKGPAVLIELAFMDTEADNRALQSATFRSIVTQAISDAVTEHFGGVAVSCPAGTYRAEYFANTTLSGSPAIVRCETSINATWGASGPGGGLGGSNYSARWRGTHSLGAGTYAFVATADDGVRVSVDGYRLIDAWTDQPPTQYRATRGLGAGNHEVLVEYYQRSGGAMAQLFWSTDLALRSPAFATSQESTALTPVGGNDGSWATRWSSRQSWTLGDEWWWTRIGSRQEVTEVLITWEAAYAAEHCIAWWSDGETQARLRCYTISAPGTYRYNIGTQSVQYIGVLMRRRALWKSNYSLWELAAYRSGGVLSTLEGEGAKLATEAPGPVSMSVPLLSGSHLVYLPATQR